jgi:hypothetical protein
MLLLIKKKRFKQKKTTFFVLSGAESFYTDQTMFTKGKNPNEPAAIILKKNPLIYIQDTRFS